MSDKKATRAAYGEALVELAEKYPQLVVLDADLSAATMTKSFAAAYPDRFFNCGIAEANMTAIAAGMASCGLKPFTNTFAVFAAGRAYEQVRNSIAYPHLNVVVVGSHGGVSVGEDGATHQMIEDLALMRSIPGMTVVNPCDAVSAKELLRQVVEDLDGPAYVRLGRAAVPVFYEDASAIKLGKGNMLRDGEDVAIISTGIMTPAAMEAADHLAEEGIDARVIDMHTLKPLDVDIIRKAAEDTGCIVTAEEHGVIGGLGSAVAEVVSQECPVPIAMVGQQDTFGESGNPDELLEKYGMTAAAIEEKVKYLVNA